jgi:hypothetical protein
MRTDLAMRGANGKYAAWQRFWERKWFPLTLRVTMELCVLVAQTRADLWAQKKTALRGKIVVAIHHVSPF